MPVTKEQAIMLLLEKQGRLLVELSEEFKALRQMASDGLAISHLPELPTPHVSVPPGPSIDTSELSAAVSESIRSSNAALTERLIELAEQSREVAKQVKNAGLSGGIRAVGSAKLRATKADGSPVEVRANDDGEILTTTSVSLDLEGVVSAGNSPSQSLAAGETFVGAWEDTKDYSAINILAVCTETSAPNGAVVQFSKDGVTAHRSVAATVLGTNDGGGGVHFSFAPEGQYFRLVYTNGSDPGDIVVQTIYRRQPDSITQLPLGAQVTANNLAQLTKTVLTAQQLDADGAPTSLFGDTQVTQDNKLLVATNGRVISHFTDTDNGALPSGTIPVIDPVLNTEPNVLDSGWINTTTFAGKNSVNVLADCGLKVFLMNASDASGANIFGNFVPTLNTTAGFPSQVSALYADDYYRIVVVNDSGSTCNTYSIRSVAAPESTDGVTTSIDESVFGFFPAQIVRSVQVARQPDGDYVNNPATGLAADVDGNAVRSSTPLGASATWQSGWMDTDGWDEVEITVAADQVSATDGLVIEYTSDANATTPTADAGVQRFTYTASDVASGSLTIRISPRSDGLRLAYTNGGTAQGTFLIEAVMRADSTTPPRAPLEATLPDTQEVALGRDVLFAKDTVSGAYSNITQTSGGLNTNIVGIDAEVRQAPLDSVSGNSTTVGASAIQVASSPPTNTKVFTFYADASNSKTILLGTDSAVSSGSAMYELAAGSAITIPVSETQPFWAISTGGNQQLRWMYGVRA